MIALEHNLKKYAKLLWEQWLLRLLVILDVVGLVVLFIPNIDIQYHSYVISFVIMVAFILLIYVNYVLYRFINPETPCIALRLMENNGCEYHLLYELTIDKIERGIINIKKELDNIIPDLSSAKYVEKKQQLEDREKEAERTKKIALIYPDDVILIYHLNISNNGPGIADIVSIDADFENTGLPWEIYKYRIMEQRRKPVVFPRKLEPGKNLNCNMYYKIKPKYRDNWVFAKKLKEINKKYLRTKIVMEIKGGVSFTLPYNLSTNGLKDTYVTLWKTMERTDLVLRAGENMPLEGRVGSP